MKLVSPPTYRWLRRHGLQDADAQDVLSEVLLTLSRNIGSYEPGRPFIRWLFAIVRSRHIDAHRVRANRPGGVGGTDFLNVVHAQADPATLEVDRDFRLDLLRQALDLLRGETDPAEWEVFRRVVLEKEPYNDVVEALGIAKPVAYRIVFGIREQLREMLAESEPLAGRDV